MQEKVKDVINPDTPMSVGLDSSLCPMSISRSDTKGPEEEKKATAKTVRELFFHVAEYREDIYKYMRDIEVNINTHDVLLWLNWVRSVEKWDLALNNVEASIQDVSAVIWKL